VAWNENRAAEANVNSVDKTFFVASRLSPPEIDSPCDAGFAVPSGGIVIDVNIVDFFMP
jgi:hypothetical protein